MYKSNKNIFAAIFAALSMGVTSGGALAGGFLDVEFGEVSFGDPGDQLVINNPYWPLRLDNSTRTFTYIGETDDECVIDQVTANHPDHDDFYTLLGDSPYNGLVAAQVVDTEWVFEEVEEGECNINLLMSPDAGEAIKELTLDWYVQDVQENIWYVGEYSQNFEDLRDEGGPDCSLYGFRDPGGVPPECTEGSWEAGMDGDPSEEILIGEAGIVVPGDEPIAGEPLTPGTYYMQEVAYEAEDMAKILKLKASVEDAYSPYFPSASYENCRKVKEWTALEPGGSVEHKWYCHVPEGLGPGLVLIEGVGGGPTEVEELVDIFPAL